MGRTLNRVAGVVSAAALATFVAAPVALAQETDTTTPETTTTTSTSETTTTTTAPTSTTATTTPSTPVTTTTTGTTSAPSTTGTKPETSTSTSASSEPPKDDYQDNTGHGFVGLGGEGVLVIACASGKIGPVETQYLTITGGPDQDEADPRLHNYSIRVVDAPAGTTTAKFSWTCDGVEGNGIVDFQQPEEPPTSTSPSTSTVPSSTAPVTTATSSAPGNAAPKAQVKVTPQGGIETGFGGTAR
ncbi:hypothetical protein [Amycolatopsis sp. NPDC051371]|uniref:hypothetical protein n=1 Tax=Amycolatopsis sp. NPDC051371 TaxID=3155800 RepID=UPI00341CEC6F